MVNMFLNIITPCSRPENLLKIADSIKYIPKENYRWIIVFDMETLPKEAEYVSNMAEVYCHQNSRSAVGHAQRNFAMGLVEKGLIYFNDDDTVIHSELWFYIKDLKNVDFVSFIQANNDGTIRLNGNEIIVGKIDSHNFMVNHEIAKKHEFEINLYYADGLFAEKCFAESKSTVYIPKILSIYNCLR